MPQCSTERFRR